LTDVIDDYVEYAAKACDAPKIYHLAMGYFVTSALLGRFVRLITPYNRRGIAPNLWVLLIGPSRIVRKTTAMWLAEDLIKEVNPNILIPASFTPEALYEMFNQLNPGDTVVWVKDEMGGFFKSLEKRYMYGVREILSSMYTGRGETRKLRNLTLRIPDGLYVCACGTMPTPPHVYLTEEDFQSGFMNRWILAYATQRERTLPLIRDPSETEPLFQGLVQKLKEYERVLSSVTPVLGITSSAQAKIEEYNRESEREIAIMEESAPGSLFAMYYGESPTLLLKLSILRRLARGGLQEPLLVIEDQDVERALQDLKAFIESTRNVIDDVQSSPRPKPVLTEEKAIERLFNYISSKGEEGASYSELLVKLRILSKDLKEYIFTLMEQERVICVKVSTGRSRPALKFFDSRYASVAIPKGQQLTVDTLRALLK
jgi:hypothetical protein